MDGVEVGSAETGRPVFSIGDLAGELGISPRAIRFYEDHGLLAPQRIGGVRVYTVRDRARLKLVLRGKRLGFSLADIGELLDLYDVDTDHLEQLNRTLTKTRARIVELEHQRSEISATLDELRDVETSLVERIATIESGGTPRSERPKS